MTQLIIDLNDDNHVIKECIQFLTNFIDESPASKPEIQVVTLTPEQTNVDQFNQQELSEDPGKIDYSQSIDVDAAGYPWDKRIHSGKKTKTQTGIWKLKRNVDKDLVKQVQEELASPVIPTNPSLPMQPSPVDVAATANANNAGGEIFQQNPAAPLTIVPVAVATWPEVLQRVTAAQNNGTLDHTKKDQFLLDNNVTGGLPLLAQRPDLFESFIAQVLS